MRCEKQKICPLFYSGADNIIKTSYLQNDKKQPKGEEEAKEQGDVNPEMLIKHPLQNTWTLWFFKIENNRTWEDCQMEIASFNTVEDFWA